MNTTTNTKTPGQFKAISVGDIHFYHHQTSTQSIIDNLNRYCTNQDRLKDVDMLIFPGDIFDRLLAAPDPQVHATNRWITELLYLCASLDVVIRLVEGTPSHDRKQSRFFIEQARNANIPVDVHYATTLEIEYLERFDMNILYVPDKWRTDTEETWQEIQALMLQRQLEHVDFAIMHGAFEYQLPSIVKEPTHNSEAFLKLVRHFICIGHVHVMSTRERILAAGSFDRLTHGEEAAKGFFEIIIRSETDYNVTFIENRRARKYVTVDCRGLDAKQADKAIHKAIKDLPKGSSVRIKSAPHDPVSEDLDGYRSRYTEFDWTTQVEKTAKEKADTLNELLEIDVESYPPIDTTSIEMLVGVQLERQAKGDGEVQKRCMHLLKELLDDR